MTTNLIVIFPYADHLWRLKRCRNGDPGSSPTAAAWKCEENTVICELPHPPTHFPLLRVMCDHLLDATRDAAGRGGWGGGCRVCVCGTSNQWVWSRGESRTKRIQRAASPQVHTPPPSVRACADGEVWWRWLVLVNQELIVSCDSYSRIPACRLDGPNNNLTPNMQAPRQQL